MYFYVFQYRCTLSFFYLANEYKITLKMTLDIPCVAADLQVPTKYDRIKASIESMVSVLVCLFCFAHQHSLGQSYGAETGKMILADLGCNKL
jgi:hypothetical protein